MLNGSIVYSLLTCTAAYFNIALSPEAQKKIYFCNPDRSD